MKSKLFISFALLFMSINFVYSQQAEHLLFKGVPIDGTLDNFVSKMKIEGFTLVNKASGVAIIKGDFAGYKDCMIGVSILKQKDLVYKIGVIFPSQETWSRLSDNYFFLKEMLNEKYGNPIEEVEKFDVSEFASSHQNDNDKMYNVEFDKCKYFTSWTTDKGTIQLSIDHQSVESCFVKLMYFDKINGDVIKMKAKKDL